jgi:hypothetical protein
MGGEWRSAVLTLAVVLVVGCSPSPAPPDRSAVKAELRGLIEDIPGSTAYRYQLKDDRGYDMGPTKVIWSPEAGAFAGIYFTWEEGPGGFVVHLATSTDLFSWDERTAYSVGASQPTIARTPTGRYVVAWEQEPDPIHLVMLEFPTWEALLGKLGTPRVMQPQVTMPACGEGTPDITSATDTRVDVTFHYHAGCERDREANGWTDWTDWHSSADPELDAALEAAGVVGHIGDRDSFTYRGYPFMLIEGETVPGDWASWRLYLYDPATRKAEQLDIRTHGGSRSFSNPGVEIVTIDGRQSLLLTMFLFSEGAAPGEAGGLLYYRELPRA